MNVNFDICAVIFPRIFSIWVTRNFALFNEFFRYTILLKRVYTSFALCSFCFTVMFNFFLNLDEGATPFQVHELYFYTFRFYHINSSANMVAVLIKIFLLRMQQYFSDFTASTIAEMLSEVSKVLVARRGSYLNCSGENSQFRGF